MKLRISPRHYLSLLLLLFFLLPSIGQVPVERTKEKAVISGVQYYLHSVKKGETLFSISKAYGITPEQLTRFNAGSRNGIKEDQILRIPVSLVPALIPVEPQMPLIQRDEKKYIYHKLQPGETVYFLSKKYNVEEAEIIKSNPGLDISKLPLGAEIAVPRKGTAVVEEQAPRQTIVQTTVQTTAPPDSKYYYHRVVKGETLASIAEMYGLTIRALRRENRDQRFPQVGAYLRIPGFKPVKPETEPPVQKDTLINSSVEKIVAPPKPAGWTPVSSLHGTMNVAVLLPFYLDENSKRIEVDSTQSAKGRRSYSVISRPDDWIYPRSLGFIEMYEGILLAADTLRSLGLDIDIHTFDITSDTTEVTRLIESGKLDKMNLIIGPVHSKNLGIIATYASSRGIPVISPVPLHNNKVLINNPTLFMANPSLEVAQKCIAKQTRNFSSDNIVLIRDDSIMTDESTGFRNMIYSELESKNPEGEIKLRDFLFYSRSVYGADSINRLGKTLSENEENLVIIDSEDSPVMSESISDVHTLSRKYNIKVFGYPNMRYLENLDPKICFDLGLMICSPYWIDYSRNNVKRFLSVFRDKFHSQPSETSYAWLGYDIAYYFVSGLSIHGNEFLRFPVIHNPELLQTEFDYRRKSDVDGFENQKLFLVKYSNNYQLELINDAESVP